MRLKQPLRVVIIGSSCSGKTTLARQLASTLTVSHIELDAIHWLPDWQSRPLEELKRLTEKAVAADEWVLDGNYSKGREVVWGRATTVIWLNYSFHLVLWRAVRRTIKRVFLREDLFSGNRESFRQSFLSKNSILVWVVTTYHRRRRDYPVIFKQPQYAHLDVFEFKIPGETAAFLSAMQQPGRLLHC